MYYALRKHSGGVAHNAAAVLSSLMYRLAGRGPRKGDAITATDHATRQVWAMRVEARVTQERMQRWKGRPLLMILFLLGSALFMIIDWMNATFGKVSFDQIRFVYHSSLSGVDTSVVETLLWRFGVIAALGLAFLLLLRLARPYAPARGLLWGGTALYAAAALAAVYNTLDLGALASREESLLIGERYVAPHAAGIAFPEKKRNLVIVLAESAEHTFNDRALFAEPVMPELEALASGHVAFRGHVQVPGTQWTIAGITSFLFGVPLRLPLFNWNDYSLFDTFLPGAQSLLEVFTAEDYEVAMILGSDSAFSGKKNLLNVHAPDAAIYDLNYYSATRDDVAANQGTGWGLADAYIFDRAREYLTRRNTDKPLLLIVETVDTHSPECFVAEDDPRRFGDERDAFAALSRNVAGFAYWLSGQDMWDNTTLVVLGDHQVMASALGGVELAETRREVYHVIVNGAGPEPEAGLERSFASFDLCPTILESVGATLRDGRLGLGVSLYRAHPTLLEARGAEEVTAELERHSPFYMDFYKASRTSLADSRDVGGAAGEGPAGAL